MKRSIQGPVLTLFALMPMILQAQIFSSENSIIYINNGALVQCNGGVNINNGSVLTNNGELRITKNSTLPNSGNFTNDSGSTTDGNGLFYVEQDWTNNASFNGGSSAVYLFGDSEQFITSDNATVTEFNDLILQGSGTGNNRKKTLLGVDARVATSGVLTISNRELATQTNEFIVLNTSPLAVTNNQTFGAEGFVSSDDPGYFNWSTNSMSDYIFPVGSSVGNTKYRPVRIQPLSASANTFKVRLNNTSGDAFGYFLAQHDPGFSTLNDNFFHSIIRSAGAASVDMDIAYLESDDDAWNAIGQWDAGQVQWNPTGVNSLTSMSAYNALSLAAWDFPNTYHPYVLANTVEELSIPNVFTPNQDGTNDQYLITGKGLTEFNIVIVNRWSEVVFESDDINTSWDGTTKGRMCSQGTYFYLINAKSNTQDYNKHGHLTLIAQ